MRVIGFSTGALAHADFCRGLALNRSASCPAVELSALREAELSPLLQAAFNLDLSAYQYVSLHAPSRIQEHLEPEICDRLEALEIDGAPIILHPDAIFDFSRWRRLGSRICIENMDRRKPTGRTAVELDRVFQRLPDATLCLDLGHAQQVDPTMTEAFLILEKFGKKLRQLHVSQVNTCSKHEPLSWISIQAFQRVAHLIPINIPLILETPASESMLAAEIAKARQALPLPGSAAA